MLRTNGKALSKYWNIVVLCFIASISLALAGGERASADAPTTSTYQRCQELAGMAGNNYGENGVIDYIWLEPESANGYVVAPGASSLRVKVKGEMSLCATHASRVGRGYIATTSQRSDYIHSVSSSTDPYAPDNGRLSPDGNLDYGTVTKANGDRVTVGAEVWATLNVSGWGAGNHQICIVSNTWTSVDSIWYAPGAPSCQTINVQFSWTTRGESRVGVNFPYPNTGGWDASPGQTAIWNHTIFNTSDYSTGGIGAAIGRSGFYYDGSPGTIQLNGNQWPWPAGAYFSLSPRANYSFGNSTANYNDDRYFKYVISQNDVGAGFNGKQAICQYVSWGPSSLNGPWGSTDPGACVRVPYNFNLQPSIEPIEGSADLVVEPGATISTVRPKVSNNGPTKSYDNTAWQLSRIVVNPGVTPPAGTDNGTDPCGYYRAGGSTCTPEASAADRTFGTGDTIVNQLNNVAVGDMEAGKKLCFALSVQKYNTAHPNNNGQWRHSTPMCVTIGKKPKVQVWGGDLSVGRRFAGDTTSPNDSSVNVSTSSKENQTKTFGSWVEYGVFAPRTITGGSSAGLAGPNGNTSSTQSDYSKLTFANSGHTPVTGCDGMVKFGCYAQASAMGIIPSVAARLAPAATNSAPQLNGTVDLTGRNGTFYSSGNLTIQASTIAKGNSVIIKAAGTVTIDGNISYTTDSLSSISDIPQVVIIANNIQIKDTVTNVDAWLIANGASGRIYSCNNYDFSQILTDKTCDKKLIINGPVMAKKLYLTRTAGSGVGPASGEPGEILNLRADAYLWAINRSQGAGRIQTTETRELAPRF